MCENDAALRADKERSGAEERSIEITGNKLVKDVLRSLSRARDLRMEPKPEKEPLGGVGAAEAAEEASVLEILPEPKGRRERRERKVENPVFVVGGEAGEGEAATEASKEEEYGCGMSL